MLRRRAWSQIGPQDAAAPGVEHAAIANAQQAQRNKALAVSAQQAAETQAKRYLVRVVASSFDGSVRIGTRRR